MKQKRKPYKPRARLLTSLAMASMRETAFGSRAYFATKEVMEHAERLRNDDALLTAAEEKRQRKAAKQRQQGGAK